MSSEAGKRLSRRCFEEVFTPAGLVVGDEQCPACEKEIIERKIFGLALALATEPSKLAQLRQMLAQAQEQRDLPEDFSTWALGQIDERVRSIALEYAHDAEVLLQLLSFKGGSFDNLRREIEDLYEHKQISGRVYVKARLLLRTAEHRDTPN
jgi:hypothetical protein